MKRDDFIAAVGYSGNTAFVDGKTKRRCGNRSTLELADQSLFRAAFCAALYDGDSHALQIVLDRYNHGHGTRYESADELKRVFGVDTVPEGVTRVKVL